MGTANPAMNLICFVKHLCIWKVLGLGNPDNLSYRIQIQAPKHLTTPRCYALCPSNVPSGSGALSVPSRAPLPKGTLEAHSA